MAAKRKHSKKSGGRKSAKRSRKSSVTLANVNKRVTALEKVVDKTGMKEYYGK